MRENRTCGSEGREGLALPDPYPVCVFAFCHRRISTILGRQGPGL